MRPSCAPRGRGRGFLSRTDVEDGPGREAGRRGPRGEGQAGQGDSESERKPREGVCRGGWRRRWGLLPGQALFSARGGGGRACGLSPVLRVGSSLRGHGGQRGDRGDPGQGPALGLFAARGISQGPQTPRVRSALIEVHLGETGVWGRLTLLGAGHLGQTEHWKRYASEKMPALWFPHGLQSWGLEEPWGGWASSHDVPSPPPNNITSEYKVSSL